MRKPDLSIVILNYNGLEWLKKCIKSVRDNTSVLYELIVIDNNSAKENFDWINENIGSHNDNEKVFLLNENKGVPGGRNVGIQNATGDLIVFLDNDVEVMRGWDFEIISSFQNPRVGIVGHGGVDVLTLNPITWNPYFLQGKKAEVDVVSGYCFAFRKTLIQQIGILREDFPNPLFWHEDLEYCLRAKMIGYKVLLNKNISIIHHEHKSMGEDKDSIMSEENQFGYLENAKYIQRVHHEDNVITFYKNFSDKNSAFERILNSIIPELRNLGFTVIRKRGITSKTKSFELCKGCEFSYKGKRCCVIFQENNLFPNDWFKEFKEYDYIFTGSEFVKTVENFPKDLDDKFINFRWGGLDAIFSQGNVEDDGIFRFLMVGASQPRKSTKELVETFYKTFKGIKNVELIIKDGGYGNVFDTAKFINSFTTKPDCPSIKYIFKSYSDEDMVSLYRKVAQRGVYVHPHKAECLGLPLLEAAACGCRIITSNFGGPKIIFEGSRVVWFVSGELTDSSFHNWEGEDFYDEGQKPKWFTPDLTELSNAMRNFYEVAITEDEKLDIYNNSNLVRDAFLYKNVALNFIKSLENVK